jgi:agmatine deiminase
MKYRLPAEWEPQSAVQLTFPHMDTDWADVMDQVVPCFVEIAETISRFQKVLVVCKDLDATRALLSRIPDDRLVLVECDSNDTWARDHGGITVEDLDQNGAKRILDFVFNGWGLKFPANKDNLITGVLHKKGVLKGTLLPGGLALEGGAIESNGAGVLMTTTECMLSPNRNPHLSQDALGSLLEVLFGVQRIIWLHHGYLAGDDTDSHIDTLARFCTPDTIAYVKCTDPSDEHFEALQRMEAELQQEKDMKLVALPWPDACYDDEGQRLPATYANFLIINGAVLVPTYQVPQDEAALVILKTIFPAHEIIGINCRPLILQHGSLHCVTMQYPLGVV